MRRFSLMIFALAALFAALIEGKDSTEPSNGQQSAPGEPALPGSGEINSAGAAASKATAGGPSDTGGAPLETAAMSEPRSDRAEGAAPADYIATAPAHVAASAKVGGIDPAVEGLTGRKLTSAIQTELKRLGCYEAEVDGKWGRKSEAAVDAVNERTGGRLTDGSRRELVSALRGYPSGFCTAASAPKAEDGARAVAPEPPAKAAPEADKNSSYLPPWMQGAKIANAEPTETGLSIGGGSLPDAAPVTAKPKKARTVRRRSDDRGRRSARNFQPRRTSRNEWLPEGWPRRR